MTSIRVTEYVPSVDRSWPSRTVSPTLRSPTLAGAPPRVIVVLSVTLTVRVQPSAVLSATLEPLTAVIVIGPKTEPPPRPANGPPPKPKRNPPIEGSFRVSSLGFGVPVAEVGAGTVGVFGDASVGDGDPVVGVGTHGGRVGRGAGR